MPNHPHTSSQAKSLKTRRLLLRDYRKEDFTRIHAYDSSPNFSGYEAWGPNTPDDTKNFIASCIQKSKHKPRYEFEYCICLKENGLLIDGCGIRKDSEASQIANIGYTIHPDFQQKGFATEAASALIEFGFGALDLFVIYATCDTRNIASVKVLEKLGTQRVGHIKNHRIVRGRLSDSYRYEINPEYLSLRNDV